jgi:hypothetical protein
MTREVRLITRREYDRMTPWRQGYAQYWQGAQEGSELRDLKNPYAVGTTERARWELGQLEACLIAQDSEE